MKKQVKDCSKKEIFDAIYNDGQTSIGDDNCLFCKYHNYSTHCNIRCNQEFENCINFEEIIQEVGNEEIEVEENAN